MAGIPKIDKPWGYELHWAKTERYVGKVLHVKAGARKLPAPERANLRRIMDTHPLIKNFPPLPSLDLILTARQNLNPNPRLRSTGAGQSQPGPPSGYVPNPSGPPTGTGYPVGVPVSSPTPSSPVCWCCIDGEIVQTTETDCRQRGGQCYGSRKKALKNCGRGGQTPTPTPYHRPSPKPHPTVTPHRPEPQPTPPPKKRYPPIRRATPTPKPGQVIR